MKISFHADFPAESVEGVESTLKELKPFLAPFIDQLTVYFEQAGEGEACIRVLRQYHAANLSLNATFFTLDAENRTRCLVHEVAHVIIDPIVREADHLLEAFFEPGATLDYAILKIEDAVETATDSLAMAILAATGLKG